MGTPTAEHLPPAATGACKRWEAIGEGLELEALHKEDLLLLCFSSKLSYFGL